MRCCVVAKGKVASEFQYLDIVKLQVLYRYTGENPRLCEVCRSVDREYGGYCINNSILLMHLLVGFETF